MPEFCFEHLGTYGWWGMILQWFLLILVLAGIVLLTTRLARRLSPSTTGMQVGFGQLQRQSSPREILQTRYVNEEITREQFQQMLADIE
jgi:uncharacterized membrane protein